MTRLAKLLCVYGGLCIIGIALYAAIEFCGLRLFCLFNALTGLRCPGCGNTRAVLSLMHGDILKSIRYNYMFIPEMAVLLYICIYFPYARIYKKKIPQIAVIILECIAVCFITWGIVRNLLNI
ncbi:MAG: DUF2752 domain-containing protein [Clostridiales bacterium]|nr:DUF2752 domain-containing protein [Clostridiales bacterium]